MLLLLYEIESGFESHGIMCSRNEHSDGVSIFHRLNRTKTFVGLQIVLVPAFVLKRGDRKLEDLQLCLQKCYEVCIVRTNI